VSRATYANTSDNTSFIELAYVVSDGDPSLATTESSNPAYIFLNIEEVNDAPSILVGDRIPVVPNGTSPIVGLNLEDPDAAFETLTVVLSVSSGTLTATGTNEFGYFVPVNGSGTTSITLQGPLGEINAFLNDSRVSFTNTTGSNSTLTITVSDGGALGDDPTLIKQDMEVVTLDVNTRPVLDASKEPSLAALVEDSPVSAIGSTPVWDLIGTSGIANYSDADGDSPGLAITGVSSKGTLHYSTNGGSTWQELSTPPSESSALLLSATARVFFKPNLHYNGAIADAITFKAWDGTFGTNGATGVDTSAPAFSLASDTASITINAVNDAPVLDANQNPVLVEIDEDAATKDGSADGSTFVSDLLMGATDVDPGTRRALRSRASTRRGPCSTPRTPVEHGSPLPTR
jgi:hypothetical protein